MAGIKFYKIKKFSVTGMVDFFSPVNRSSELHDPG